MFIGTPWLTQIINYGTHAGKLYEKSLEELPIGECP